MRLGQTGTVTVTTANKANVLYVSTTAITTTGVGKTVQRAERQHHPDGDHHHRRRR